MPSTEQLRTRLVKKLAELFQLNQPDLDFGFYRIMRTKAKEVQSFIDKDLLQIVSDAFGEFDESKKSELQTAYIQALQTAKDYGAPDPEKTDGVKKAKAALDAVKATVGNEAEVYDHLYRFFERYYDDGDFVSRRYFTRETSGKAAPFAVPYNGEEIKLHWANADQYYVKSAEYFSNFSFNLIRSVEVRAMSDGERILMNIPDDSHMVHFRVVEASEGEHGNVKASDATKRFFIIHKDKPVEFSDTGELIINFEYRNDPEKTGKDSVWRDKRIAEAVETILSSNVGHAHWELYKQLLTIPAPTEKERARPILKKYINQYTSRNTMDYFIHKDLGPFLKRELDFYIKNEVMQLDDIENADAPAVESYLTKIKVLRKIAGKLIDFLAQLENFQKRLWLKKKFVVETNYCITLDRVPEELYPEITDNEAQLEEWVEQFAIDEIKGNDGLPGMTSPGFSKPLTVNFLKANDKLVLDTKFFDEEFKARLIASIENFDEQCDGLLIHSENFQALNNLQERYRAQVKCLYVDPPFNTGDSKILYKNIYDSSAWLSLMENRIKLSYSLLDDDFVYFIAIDDYEMAPLCELVDTHFPFRREMIVINHHPQGGKAVTLANTHEYMLTMVSKDSDRTLIGRTINEDNEERPYKRSGTAESNYRYGRPNSFYAILVDPNSYKVVGVEPPPDKGDNEYPTDNTSNGYVRVYPIGKGGSERVWRNAFETGKQLVEAGKLKSSPNFTIYQLIEHGEKKTALFSNWTDKKYNAGTNGANLLKDILGTNPFGYPKSIYTVEDAIFTYSDLEGGLVLDYFAGSGTTGHAVINLNRQDDLGRKYILVEMGNHFDTVLKPRLSKIIYSPDWKNGKPLSRNLGVSQVIKYTRLESYEDTLNNIQFAEDSQRSKALASNPGLKQDYLLGYMIDVETRGSQSLLNIDAFSDPSSYSLKVKNPGSDEYSVCSVDLLETFNFLIGLRVQHISAPVSFSANFTRMRDPELPEDHNTRLVVDGKIQQAANGLWWFRKVEGWVPKDPLNPNNGQKEKVLVVWRKLTGNLEKDNLMLDEWFQKNRISTRDFEFDTIYVNGSNNLPNLKLDSDTWKVRLTEEEFMKRMWDVEGL